MPSRKENSPPEAGDLTPGNGDRPDPSGSQESSEPTPDAPDAEADEVSKDKLFKTAFRFFFANLVELLDPELAATLDLDDPEFLPPEVFADFKKHGHAEPDVVARVSSREGEPRLVLLHVEVEAEFRETIDRRVKRYSMHLELEFDLPVVSAVVFLTGGQAGVELREVRTVIGGREYGRFCYLAFGLSQSLAEEYMDRPQPLAAALAALMRSETWDKLEKKLCCLETIHRRGLPLAQEYVLAKIVETTIDLDPEEQERYQELERQHGKEVHEMAVTWEEALAERESLGVAKGIAKGKAEGKAEGKLEGARQAIALLAKHVFVSLPSGFAEKLRAINDLSRLYEILEQVSEVRSVEELDLSS